MRALPGVTAVGGSGIVIVDIRIVASSQEAAFFAGFNRVCWLRYGALRLGHFSARTPSLAFRRAVAARHVPFGS
jgi:hypothetical protein